MFPGRGAILISIIILLYLPELLFCQSRNLDYNSYKRWPIIGQQEISNDGKFVSYIVGTDQTANSLFVQALDGPWKQEVAGALHGQFTKDSRRFVFMNSHDSLGIMDLAGHTIRYIAQVTDFRMPKNGSGNWLGYIMVQPVRELVLYNCRTNENKKFQDITNFQFGDDGNSLWLRAENGHDDVPSAVIRWMNLETNKDIRIYRGRRVSDPTFDPKGDALCFLAEDSLENRLYYYKVGMDSAELLVDSSSINRDKRMVLGDGSINFDKNGDEILFWIEKPVGTGTKTETGGSDVSIRNYREDLLRAERQEEYGPLRAMINLENPHTVHTLVGRNERDLLYGNYDQRDYLVLERKLNDHKAGSKWGFSDRVDLYLVFPGNGERKLIKKGVNFYRIACSPDGKYLIWFDLEQKQWFTYDMAGGLCKNITARIGALLAQESPHPNSRVPYGLAGWIEKDAAIIVQDQFDLWRVDPQGAKSPVNLTGGYGLKNKIVFRYMDWNEGESQPTHKNDTLILSAFNCVTKDNGFFRLIPGDRYRLEKLTMEPRMYYYYRSPKESAGAFGPFVPIKAKFASKYIVERMSPTEYPNLYVSNDLKEFQAVTEYEPQKQYNWYSTELCHWKLPDGRAAEGVLYKPQDFNPHKKYPVIFFYYEQFADALNNFIHPALSNGVMNIPWFVSNGYLVFVPDIYYTDGYPGRSALNSLVSAAHFLSKMSFVDSEHMGLQGHSFGGFETNYIVSHTGIFAAAAPSSGVSDLVSGYGHVYGYYEHGQGRIGATFWERPDLYIENSSFFMADKVTTPILILHNIGDHIVQFDQGLEWFNALTRLGKKVWMLSYNGEGHTIENEKNQLDYSIRLGQFFDHFLKGMSAPKWMEEEGVP
jgi:dienelactone hydrolase